MDKALSSLKPINSGEWLDDITSQEAFLKAFAGFLIKELAFQVSDVEKEQASAFITSNLPEGLYSDLVARGSAESGEALLDDSPEPIDLYDLDMNFARGQQTLVIRDVHFPANDERLGFGYTQLLKLFPSLHFYGCHFYSNDLALGYVSTTVRFEACTFHLPWQVDEASGPGQDHVLFATCRFEQGVAVQGDELGLSPIDSALVFFRDSVIRKTLSLTGVRTEIPVFANTLAHKPEIDTINIQNCELSGRFTLANTESIGEIRLASTVFKDKFALIHCPIDQFSAKNVNFEGLADFYQSTFESFLIRKSIFRDFAGFEDCRFGPSGKTNKQITLRYVSFYSFINFRNAEFCLPLDLRNTNRHEQPNFLDCSFSQSARTGTDRETFRIIKHSFEAVGNRIEANVFFAHEMEAYRRELREATREHGCRWRLWERLLVWFNFVLSRHGQSYWQPLLGVLICAAVVALQQANWLHGWLEWPEAAAKYIEPVAEALNAWAGGLIVLRPLYANFPGQEAFILLMTVLLSTCIWHFLVAARRHHRR